MVYNYKNMRDLRTGECLWSEWTGDGFSSDSSEPIFFTQGHIDIEHEVVSRALASALQRDGSAVTLGDGFRLVERARVTHGFAGIVDSDVDFAVCDELGETREGDEVDEVLEITWVDFYV
jgi:hypothetical protein